MKLYNSHLALLKSELHETTEEKKYNVMLWDVAKILEIDTLSMELQGLVYDMMEVDSETTALEIAEEWEERSFFAEND